MRNKNILITGSSGFIGQKLSHNCFDNYKIIAIDNTIFSENEKNIIPIKGDITETELLESVCKKYQPSFVIHCAGIAHQKFGSIDYNEYLRVNSHATEKLARAAIKANPSVYFIFLSSISVYGEDKIKGSVSEDAACNPSSDYAVSKLDAEKRLLKLYDTGLLKRLDILRLAPVYDSDWSLNLDRRVFAPKKVAYLKFGSGEQKMSAVSRQNLVDFIEYRLSLEGNNLMDNSFCDIINVCDAESYKFNQIIKVFKQSDSHPSKMVLTVPLFFVWIATHLAGLILKDKKQWLHSCYDKLAYSLVFDNKKMLATGFIPKYRLEYVFLNNK